MWRLSVVVDQKRWARARMPSRCTNRSTRPRRTFGLERGMHALAAITAVVLGIEALHCLQWVPVGNASGTHGPGAPSAVAVGRDAEPQHMRRTGLVRACCSMKPNFISAPP
jgi:hypothetical protein